MSIFFSKFPTQTLCRFTPDTGRNRFYKRNIRNIAGVNDSGRRTPRGGDVTFGVYRRYSSAVELAIIFLRRILFADAAAYGLS